MGASDSFINEPVPRFWNHGVSWLQNSGGVSTSQLLLHACERKTRITLEDWIVKRWLLYFSDQYLIVLQQTMATIVTFSCFWISSLFRLEPFCSTALAFAAWPCQPILEIQPAIDEKNKLRLKKINLSEWHFVLYHSVLQVVFAKLVAPVLLLQNQVHCGFGAIFSGFTHFKSRQRVWNYKQGSIS